MSPQVAVFSKPAIFALLDAKPIRMKKSSMYALVTLLILAMAPVRLPAAVDTVRVATTAPLPAAPAEVNTLIARVLEIQRMDKSGLSPQEKRQLRKELRTIKKTLRQQQHGIYLSVGAIIIIILLLILIL